MAELNGGQLAILLQNWNHPVIRPFLATAATGLAVIAVYERGLPIHIDMERLNHFVAHLAPLKLGRGLYAPEKQMGPNHPTSEIFGLLGPELFSTAKITARTSAPELLDVLDRIESDGPSAHFHITPDISTIIHHSSNDSTYAHFQATSHLITSPQVLPSHTSGASHFTTVLPTTIQVQTTSVSGNGSVLGLAAAAVVATGAIFSACKKYKNYKNKKLTDAQCIAYLKQQLDEVSAYRLTIETALKAAENDLSMSNGDKNRLRGELSVSTTLNRRLIDKLEKAEEDRDRNTKLVDETIKRLEAEQKRAGELERDRNTRMQENNNLRVELYKVHSTINALRDEKSAHEREVQKQLAASELAATATQEEMSAKIDDLNRQKTNHELRSLKVEEELRKQLAAAEADLRAKQHQLQNFDDRNRDLENTLASVNKKVEELQITRTEALASLEVAQSAAEEKSKLQQENENQRDLVTRLQTELDEQSDEHMRECDGLREKIDSKDISIDIAQGEISRLNSQLNRLKETFEEQIREKDSEVEDLRKHGHEVDVALSIAQERIVQLEKEKATRDLPKLSIPKTGAKNDDEDDLNDHATESIDRSRQGSSQQQACGSSMLESSSNNTTTEEVSGEHSSTSMTMPVPPSGELNIPSRKRRELWHNYWKHMTTAHVYAVDEVCKMELPCFDARFSRLGIARPAENPEDRTLESGKVLEHTKCNHCLQWYTKKDMYNHLKTCKAFWEIAIRCGYCKEVFKHNTAFFDKHVPDCKMQSTEEDTCEKHYTLVNSEVDATTPQTSQQVSLTSNDSISPGKQINPDAPPFTPGGSSPNPKLPTPTGPRYHNPNVQQVRGISFNSPKFARSPQFMPYMTPRGNPPAHASGFGTPSPAARPPTGPQAYSAPRDNSQTHGSPGQGQQGYPQTPQDSFSMNPGYMGRR